MIYHVFLIIGALISGVRVQIQVSVLGRQSCIMNRIRSMYLIFLVFRPVGVTAVIMDVGDVMFIDKIVKIAVVVSDAKEVIRCAINLGGATAGINFVFLSEYKSTLCTHMCL